MNNNYNGLIDILTGKKFYHIKYYTINNKDIIYQIEINVLIVPTSIENEKEKKSNILSNNKFKIKEINDTKIIVMI